VTALRLHDELRERRAKVARWRVADPVVRDGYVKLFDRTKGQDEHVLFDTLNAKIGSCELVVVRGAAPRLSPATQGDAQLDVKLQSVSECLIKLEEIQRKQKCSFAAAIRAATGKDGSPPLIEGALPSRPTLYRYRDATRQGVPALRGDKNKGNRTSRYSDDIVNVIETAAETHYLVDGSPWDLGDLTENVNIEVHSLGLLHPGKKISPEFVSRCVAGLTVDSDIDRMNPKEVAAAKSVAAERIVVALPFERVEQDGLHLPFIVNYNGQPTGGIWLVHAIDCGTGVPTGWHLKIGAPGESDGLKCVQSTLYSKVDAFRRLGLEGEISIDICGTPRILVLDNGPEAKGYRMRRLNRIWITPQYCKSRHPQHKPFIERLNRALKRALQRLPGSTRFNNKDGARDPVALGDRLMTLEELEIWIVRWYYQKWAKKMLHRHAWSDFHDREKLGSTPEERWVNFGKRGYPRRMSPPLSKWHMTLYEHHEATLNRKTGLPYLRFSYRGRNLKYLIDQYGEVKVKFMVDPDDYRQVLVYDGEGMPLVSLVERYVTPETPAYSFAYMQKQRSEMLADRPQDPVAAKFDQDMDKKVAEASVTRKPPKKMTTTQRNKAGAAAAKQAAAVDLAAQRPIVGGSTSAQPDMAGTAYTFADVPELPALSRATGEAQR